MVQAFLEHPALGRLRNIRQLGYVSDAFPHAGHTRWEHTLQTIDAFCRLLENLPSLPDVVRRHLLAVATLQDIGQAPFSNSLNAEFTLPGTPSSALIPHDMARAVVIIEYLEASEKFLTQWGLEVPLILSLFAGKSPWPRFPWVSALLESSLDVDRILYVHEDATRTGIGDRVPSLAEIARSIRWDESAHSSIIRPEGIGQVEMLVRGRTKLYVDVYLEPRKIACEVLMRSFLSSVWESKGNQETYLPHVPRPTTVPEFLACTDRTLDLSAFPHMTGTSALLTEFHRLLANREFYVIEVYPEDGDMRFGDIDQRLHDLSLKCFPEELIWVMLAGNLPSITVYRPGSILIQESSSFLPIETRVESFRINSSAQYRLRPLIVCAAGRLESVLQELSRLALKGTSRWLGRRRL